MVLVWGGGKVADVVSGEFIFRVKPTQTLPSGETVCFPAVQELRE